MDTVQIENIEINLLLEAIYQRYGYDYRNYSRASLKRRLVKVKEKYEARNFSHLTDLLLHDESLLNDVINQISVTVTEMFRDPEIFVALREKVIPKLKTYPRIRIWHAGCATGEEVYSMAILLKEAEIYDRCEIFATDVNPYSLEYARKGIYPIQRARTFTSNYQIFGGKKAFSDYYHATYDSMKISSSLSENVTFVEHNLVKHGKFIDMHLILCRNVLIYFNQQLQDGVLELFSDSLVQRGFLCIGTKETLETTSVHNNFEAISRAERIYQKKSIFL